MTIMLAFSKTAMFKNTVFKTFFKSVIKFISVVIFIKILPALILTVMQSRCADFCVQVMHVLAIVFGLCQRYLSLSEVNFLLLFSLAKSRSGCFFVFEYLQTHFVCFFSHHLFSILPHTQKLKHYISNVISTCTCKKTIAGN